MRRLDAPQQSADCAHIVSPSDAPHPGLPHPGLPMPRRAVAIAALSFGSALVVIDGAIPNVALPTIARDLGVSQGAVVSVVSLYQLVVVMGLLPFGNIADRIGHRRTYQAGQTIFMLASAAALFVDNFALLLVLRAVQALGAGMALSVSSAMLRTIYPEKRLGSGLGLNSVIVASSNAIAPTLGGLIVADLDWRWVFCAAVPFALISLLLGRALPETEPRRGHLDLPGGAWSAATFGFLIGGLELAVHGNLILGLIGMAMGAVSAVLFYRRESGRARPVLPIDLLRNRVVALSVLGSLTAFVASSSLVVALPFRFETGMGFPPEQVGLLILPFPMTLMIVAPLAGYLADRVQPSFLGMGGMVLAVLGLTSLAMLPHHPHWGDIAWRLSLTAAGFGMFFPPNARLIIGQSPHDRAASAGGLIATTRLLGQTMGATMVGILLAMGAGLSPIPTIVAAMLCAVAALCSLVRLRTT